MLEILNWEREREIEVQSQERFESRGGTSRERGNDEIDFAFMLVLKRIYIS